jgi:hypothetical protein
VNWNYLTGEEESNTFTFIHKRERKEGPHVEAVAALTSELENLKNSVASIPGPASDDYTGYDYTASDDYTVSKHA